MEAFMRLPINPRIIAGFLYCAVAARAATPVPILFDSPRGGEVYFNGQQQSVRLNAKTRAKSVAIELSRDGGFTFTSLGTINNMVKDKTKLNVLSFTVAGAGSNNCVLRATAGASSGLSGEFTITSGAVVIQPGTVGVQELADGSVTTPKLADGSVINPKLAPLAVSNDKVTSGPASSGMVLMADGLGNALWNSVPGVTNFSGPLAGDVNGTQSATAVSLVGGVTAANVASGASAANAATVANMPNTIVKRAASGN